MNRTQTLSHAVEVVSHFTWRERSDVELAARDLIENGRLPKSIGRNFAQYDSRGLGQLILAMIVSERPSCADDVLSTYENLRSLTSQNAEAVQTNTAALERRGLSLDTLPLNGIATLGTLFKKNYLDDQDWIDRIAGAKIHIDRSHPSAIVEWRDRSATVFGTLAKSRRGDFFPSTVNVLPITATWDLYLLIEAQKTFFEDTEGRGESVGYTGR